MANLKKSTPLWLPEGSVRATIALATVGALLYMAVNQLAVEDWSIMAFTLIVTSYFEQRRPSKGQDTGAG